jgi:hypothetical protein
MHLTGRIAHGHGRFSSNLHRSLPGNIERNAEAIKVRNLVLLEVTGDLVEKLIEMTLHDPSIRVRRAVLHNLGASCSDPRSLKVLEEIVLSEPDVEMVLHAKRILEFSNLVSLED